MKIEKLKSGSYRIRKTYQGKTYTVVVPYKPTQKECLRLMADEMDKAIVVKTRMTFETAAREYIETKSNVLSPATIRGYESIIRGISNTFKKKLIGDITSVDIQKEINKYSKDHSPKSVRNNHGFITAVMSMFAPNTIINTTLPQKIKNEPYIPNDDDIRAILKEAKGTKYEIPIMLACFGLRRSEICALTIDDIGDGCVRVNKALVEDKDHNFVIKQTKTAESTRTVVVTKELTDMIKAQGYVYKGYPSSIYAYLKRTLKKLGIEHFSLHKLRHYYASMSHSIGIPDVYIMAGGGWKTDNVLKNVYRHALSDKKEEMLNKPASYISDLISIP